MEPRYTRTGDEPLVHSCFTGGGSANFCFWQGMGECGSSGAFRHPLALRMASCKDFLISLQSILEPSGVTMRLFSRTEFILQQASKSCGAAAMRYASRIRGPSPLPPWGNSAMMDESAAKTPTTSPIILLKYQDPFARFSITTISAP